MVISGIDVLNLIIEVTGVIMSIFALFILIMTPGRDKATFRYLLAGFLSFLASIYTAYLISKYLLTFLGLEERTLRRLQITLDVIFIVQLVFLVYAQATGKLSITDGISHFVGGLLSISGYIMAVFYMALDLLILMTWGKSLSDKQKHAFTCYLGLPFLTLIGRKGDACTSEEIATVIWEDEADLKN